jgi:hypothetical protein
MKVKTDAEKLFLKYKKAFIKEIGRQGMYNDQFKKIIPFLDAVWCQDTAKVKKGYYIINTDISTGKGQHWIACYQTKTRCYLYDSFSRTPKYLVPIFIKKLEAKNIKIYESDISDSEQYGNTEVCGQLCSAWLHVVKVLGIRKAMTI